MTGFTPGGPLREEQARLLGRVQELCETKIGPRAPRIDREAVNPVESWRDLWELGLLAMRVPKAYGGLGLDDETYVLVIERIARSCAATAMTLHMHSSVMDFIDVLGTDAQKRENYAIVVDGGRTFGSWSGEASSSVSRQFHRETRISPRGSGYVINGEKFFCTMAGAAARAQIFTTLEGSNDHARDARIVLVSEDNPGMEIFGGWDPVGMRGTVSPSVRFKDCYVEADSLLGNPLNTGVVEQFWLGHSAIYLGIATGALEATAEYCRTKTFVTSPEPLAADVTIQRTIGDLSADLDAVRVVVRDAARHWQAVAIGERTAMASRAKYLSQRAGVRVTDACMQLIGGRAALRQLPIERAWRDLRVCTLMPPSGERMQETLGKRQLQLSDTVFTFKETVAR
jgi:alkylation response protein AidB-like acyl-CoA dehydrogenase